MVRGCAALEAIRPRGDFKRVNMMETVENMKTCVSEAQEDGKIGGWATLSANPACAATSRGD